MTRNYTSSTTTTTTTVHPHQQQFTKHKKEERTQLSTKEKEGSTQMGAMQADKARRVTNKLVTVGNFEPKQTSLLQQAHNSLSFPFLSDKKEKKKKKLQ
jgi:hypothetical protein